MSTIASRPFKVSSVRSAPADGIDKNSTSASNSGYLARAVTLHLAGKREEALKQLERALVGAKPRPKSTARWDTSSLRLEAYAEAAESYRSFTELKPQYAMGWFNLAVCLERMEDWDDASQAFHKASTLDPTHLEAHLGLGVCHLRLEDPKSALFAFERVSGTSRRPRGRAVRQSGGPAVAGPRRRSLGHLPAHSGAQSGVRGIALEPGADRHVEGRFRHGARVFRTPARAATGIRQWRSKGWPRGPAPPAIMRSPRSSARCWFPRCPRTSRAGSTWGWRTRNPAAGNRPPKLMRKP